MINAKTYHNFGEIQMRKELTALSNKYTLQICDMIDSALIEHHSCVWDPNYSSVEVLLSINIPYVLCHNNQMCDDLLMSMTQQLQIMHLKLVSHIVEDNLLTMVKLDMLPEDMS
jgi:hypothetical protein